MQTSSSRQWDDDGEDPELLGTSRKWSTDDITEDSKKRDSKKRVSKLSKVSRDSREWVTDETPNQEPNGDKCSDDQNESKKQESLESSEAMASPSPVLDKKPSLLEARTDFESTAPKMKEGKSFLSRIKEKPPPTPKISQADEEEESRKKLEMAKKAKKERGKRLSLLGSPAALPTGAPTVQAAAPKPSAFSKLGGGGKKKLANMLKTAIPEKELAMMSKIKTAVSTKDSLKFLKLAGKAHAYLNMPPGQRERSMAVEVMPVFKRLRFFQQVPIHVVHYILMEARLELFGDGERVVKQGQPAESFYITLTGSVGVYVKFQGHKVSQLMGRDEGNDTSRSNMDLDELSQARGILAKLNGKGVGAAAHASAAASMFMGSVEKKRIMEKYKGVERTLEVDAQIRRELQHGMKVAELQRGQSFGELSFLKEHRRNATVFAIGHCELLQVSTRDYNRTQKFTGDRMFNLTDDMRKCLDCDPVTRTHAMVTPLVDTLGGHPFFNGVDSNAIFHICRNMFLHKMPASFCVFEQGTLGSRFYIIVTGSVSFHLRAMEAVDLPEVPRYLTPGQYEGFPVDLEEDLELRFGNCMTTFNAGDGFGEKALVSTEPRMATAVTRERTELLVVERSTLQSMNVFTSRMQQRVRPSNLEDILSIQPYRRPEKDLLPIVEYASSLHFFKNLSPETRLDLLRKCGYVNAQNHLVLFRQGDPADLFYVILEGSVSIHKYDDSSAAEQNGLQLVNLRSRREVANDKEAVMIFGTCVCMLYAGNVFGELGLDERPPKEEEEQMSSNANTANTNKRRPRAATVITHENTILLTLTQVEYRLLKQQSMNSTDVQILEMLCKLPALRDQSWDLLHKLSKLLNLQVFVATHRLMSLGSKAGELMFIKTGGCKVYMCQKMLSGEITSLANEQFVPEHKHVVGGPLDTKNPPSFPQSDSLDTGDVLTAEVEVGSLAPGEAYGIYEFGREEKMPCMSTLVCDKLTQAYFADSNEFMALLPDSVKSQLVEFSTLQFSRMEEIGKQKVEEHSPTRVDPIPPLFTKSLPAAKVEMTNRYSNTNNIPRLGMSMQLPPLQVGSPPTFSPRYDLSGSHSVHLPITQRSSQLSPLPVFFVRHSQTIRERTVSNMFEPMKIPSGNRMAQMILPSLIKSTHVPFSASIQDLKDTKRSGRRRRTSVKIAVSTHINEGSEINGHQLAKSM